MDRKHKLKDSDEEMVQQPRVQPDAEELEDIDLSIFEILQPGMQPGAGPLQDIAEEGVDEEVHESQPIVQLRTESLQTVQGGTPHPIPGRIATCASCSSLPYNALVSGIHCIGLLCSRVKHQ